MALINCPECGRENASDAATSCPSCGYNIQEHFDKIAKEEQEVQRKVEQEKLREKNEKEKKERENSRLEAVPMPTKPKYPIAAAIIGALVILISIPGLNATQREIERSISQGSGDPHFQSVCLIFLA